MIKTDDSTINDFRGENEFLSNFHPSAIIIDDELYPTIEHAFQAAKTNDLALKAQIRNASSAREAKKLGRNLTLIQNWDNSRLDIMASLVKQKFQEHPDLKIRLLLTGNKELIQGNTWKDHFWGQDKDGAGHNHLGKILMSIRSALRAAEGGAFQVLTTFLKSKKLGDMAVKLEELFKFSDQMLTLNTSLVPVDVNFDKATDLLDSLT